MADLGSIKLSQLPTTIRLVLTYTIVLLAVGYLIAMVNLYLTYSLTDGQPGLTVDDLKRAFYGKRDNTRMAAKIHGGSMEQFLPNPGDKEKILSWIQDGASETEYQASIRAILMQNCVRCHSPGGLQHFRPLTSYEEVMTVVQIDRGEPVGLWARVAHTHVQSIGLIFLVLGLIFALASVPAAFKYVVISAPFLSLLMDFGSRFLAKYNPDLVYLMMASGALLGLSFGVMSLVPLYEMWLKKKD